MPLTNNVVPIPSYPLPITQLCIYNCFVNYGVSNSTAIAQYSLLDVNNQTVSSGSSELTSAQFLSWDNDDELLMEYVATNLNVVLEA